MKINKIINIAIVAIFILQGFSFQGLAEENAFDIIQSENYIIVSGFLPNLSANSNIGVLVLDDEKTLHEFENISGEITDKIVLAKQVKLTNNKRFSISIPINNKLPYGTVNVYISSTEIEGYIETSFTILKVTINGNSGGHSDKIGDYKLLKNNSFVMTLNPSENYFLKYIKVNNEIKLENRQNQTIYSTDPLNSDTMIEYYFLTPDPTVVDTATEAPEYRFKDFESNLNEEQKNQVSDKITALIGAKADLKTGDYRRISCGFILSKSLMLINTQKEECIKVPAQNIAENGAYAVMFYGEKSLIGNRYYAQSYAQYYNEKEDKTIMVYGTVKPFKLNEFLTKVYMDEIFVENKLNQGGIRVYRMD